MAGRSLGTLSLDLVMQMGGFEEGMSRAERATEKFSKGIKKQQNDLDRLIGKIDPVVGRLSELDKMEEQLRKHQKDGILPKDDFDHYLKKLGELRNATGASSDDFKKAGMSAKQLAAATRGLPAQFTDIAVSLQGGQRPMTVLMQQGGQLKDMFGGIGPAAKAMGGYIAGLVNPYTVAAAAIGSFGVAAYQGAQEANALRNAIILTGRSATELNQLREMAQSLSRQMHGVTTSQMSAALAEVAANGAIASQNIARVSTAAEQMNQSTGKAISDTVSEFEQLQKNPSKAISDLDEKYHFLTASVYSQIAALERQGKHQEAADLATKAYADTVADRSKDIADNLGWIEKGWKHVAGAARLAWDDMKNAGRGAAYSLQQQNEFDNQLIESYKNGRGGGMTLDLVIEAQNRIKQRNIEIAKNKEAAAIDEKRQTGARAQVALEDALTASLTKQQKKRLELNELKKNQNEAVAVGKGLSAADYIAAKKAIEDKYSTGSHHSYRNDAGASRMQSLRETEASLRAQLTTVSKLTSAEQDLARFNQQIADLKGKRQLTTEEKSLKTNASQLRQQYEINAELSRQVKHHEEAVKLQERLGQLRDTMASAGKNQQQQYSDQLAGIGLGDRARQQIKEREAIRREFDRYREQLDKTTPESQRGSEDYQTATADIEQQMQLRLQEQQTFYANEAKLRGDWMNGVSQSWHTYLEQAQDVAANTRSVFDAAFKGMEDSLVGFVRTGKLSFGDLANSILDGMAKIAVQQAVLGLAGMFGGSFAGSTTAPTGTVRLNGALGLQAHADGGYIAGPGTATSDSIPAMLSDGEFVMRSSVVSQPGVREILEAMNSGRRYATGGYVAKSDASAGMPARWANPDRSAGDGSAGDQIESDGTIRQEFHFHGGGQSAELVQQLREAAAQGAEMGYRRVLNDFRTNGPGRRMLG